jgi:predicted dienelactone hydrolase
MLKLSVFTGAVVLSIATLAHCADAVGFREINIGKDGDRPLHLAVWYPASAKGDQDMVGENRVFYGVSAIKDGASDSSAHPLAVLSHGYGGSWRNLSWLAIDMAGQGFIVAAPDHPGTTTFDRNADQAAKLWERPHDLSRVIDALSADAGIAGLVDASRIAAIGHSLGGWTITALAGGRFDTKRFQEDCRQHASPRACALTEELGLDDPQIERAMEDPRVGAFVSLDLGGARGFSPESLVATDKPFLVLAAGVDIGDMPAGLESGYLAQNLPKSSSTYVEIPDAMHFTFMQVCKPGAADLIEEETPGDGIVCKDGGARGRDEIHRDISYLVNGFVAQALGIR